MKGTSEVDLEDVLAARVVKKSLSAIGAMLGLVLLTLGYVGFDLHRSKEQLDDDRTALHAQLEAARAQVKSLTDTLRMRVDSTRDIVAEAKMTLSSYARAMEVYQTGVASQMANLGAMQVQVATTRDQAEHARSTAESTLHTVGTLQTALEQRSARDSAALKRFMTGLDSNVSSAVLVANGTSERLLSSWTQVVTEEEWTPLSNSHFMIVFDDVKDNVKEKYVTGVKMRSMDGKKARVDVRDRLYLGEAISVRYGDQEFRLTIEEAYREKVWWGAHIDRVVIRLERVAAAVVRTTRTGGAQ